MCATGHAVARAAWAFRPEVVLHLAAQPLVRLSYRDPVETYSTNVMGTVHLLEAARHCDSVRAIVNVTTDKCYDNREWVWGYREGEPMGGHDPYSSSKACSELVSSAYRASFLAEGRAALATARAGNVIGGGDWAADRLIPDILLAFETRRGGAHPQPARHAPWQHVLEPLGGYLRLAEQLVLQGQAFAEAWNFGPLDDDVQPVQWIVEHLAREWGGGARWAVDAGEHPHEARFLKLDISKARQRLQWQPHWRLGTALSHIVAWHQAWLAGQDMRALCLQQIASTRPPKPPALRNLHDRHPTGFHPGCTCRHTRRWTRCAARSPRWCSSTPTSPTHRSPSCRARAPCRFRARCWAPRNCSTWWRLRWTAGSPPAASTRRSKRGWRPIWASSMC
jgi:CDP-glucose 4,6-dehydratase